MGEAIGQSLPFAVGIALSPIPIVGVVLMLGTPRGRINGPAFVAGWIVGLSAVGAVVLVVSRDLLDGLRGWMASNSAATFAVICLLIGAKLIGDAISGLSG